MDDEPTLTESATLSALLTKATEDELELCRARSRVYALCNHYSERFDGEDCDADLASAMFKGIYNGAVSSIGPLQVVGAYTHSNSEFSWAWQDAAVPELAYEDVKAFIMSEPNLVALSSQSKFQCKQSSAEKLVQWIAVKMGWSGAYEIPTATGLSYLILNIRPGDTYDPTAAGDMWCSYCGRSSRMVAQLFQASSTCSICNVCVRLFVDLLTDLEQSGGLSTDDATYMVPCLVCGDKTPRIFSNYGAICYECLRIPAFQAVE